MRKGDAEEGFISRVQIQSFRNKGEYSAMHASKLRREASRAILVKRAIMAIVFWCMAVVLAGRWWTSKSNSTPGGIRENKKSAMR
jgi:hypothetical protein